MVRILQAIQTLARLTSSGQVSRLRTSDFYAWSWVLSLVSCAALISAGPAPQWCRAGVVFVLCAAQWLQGASASEEIERNLGPPVLERFRQAGPAKAGNGQQAFSALVRQAEAFALYLNPPKPPKGEKAPAPKRISKQTIPAAIATKITPKFRLVGTSYYRSRPEESMALVSQPGSGTHWVKQGERLGHFVVEKVKRGTIVYRHGDQLGEMAEN